MNQKILEARLRLFLCPGLGPVLIERLVKCLGNAENAVRATTAQLQEIEGIGVKKAPAIRRGLDQADVDAELRLMHQADIQVASLDDETYPVSLRHIYDPPPLLFYKGRLEPRDVLSLAIVGARRCTGYGAEQADRMAALCSNAGLTIVSGGALGIDTAAHRAVLRVGGRTIAVLGSGLGRYYPPENAKLFDAIVQSGGALVSECPTQMQPLREHFPRRNRIISGLSLGILVVEADRKSGALITARLAAEEHHREVMAMPGRADSHTSSGCHQSIREGWATLVTSPAEVLESLGEAGQTLRASLQLKEHSEAGDSTRPKPVEGSEVKNQILAMLTDVPVDLDDLIVRSGLSVGVIQAQLTTLQLSGQVERLPGNRVRLRSSLFSRSMPGSA